MKKILIFVLVISNYSFGQPASWAALGTLQTVSEYTSNYAMFQSPYLQSKAPLPNGLTSLHNLTKAQLIAAFYVDVTNTYLAAKSSSQIVVKRDVTALAFTGYFSHNRSNAQTSGAGACGTTLANISPIYTSTNTAPTVGTIFYTNTALTTTFGGSNLWWLVTYSTGSYYVLQIDGTGNVISTSACSTSPQHS